MHKAIFRSTNYYYQWQISQCVSGAGNANTGSNQPNWYAIQECQDGYYMEWYVVVTGFENDIAGAETGLWGMYPDICPPTRHSWRSSRTELWESSKSDRRRKGRRTSGGLFLIEQTPYLPR